MAVCVAVAALVAGLGGLSNAPVALAHAELDSSNPADGEAVMSAVSEIVLTFTEPVEPVAGGFEVFLPSTEVVQVVPETTDDLTFVLAFDPPLGNGEVGVRYDVISADGHPVTGSFAFSIDAPVPASTLPASTIPAAAAPIATVVIATTPTSTPASTPAMVPAADSTAPTMSTAAPPSTPDTSTPDTTTPATTVARDDSSGNGTQALLVVLVVAIVLIGGVVAFVARHRRTAVPPPVS